VASPELLEQLEANVIARGGVVHWARDAAEANQIVLDLVRATGADEVVKVKSMATQEIGLNQALEAAGITAHETDLAELIVQLGHDKPSHILVPAIHRGRAEIRDIFAREMPGLDPTLTDEPAVLAAAARTHLREVFLRARVAVSGANFGVAETGTLTVVESEGNGRMCLTLLDNGRTRALADDLGRTALHCIRCSACLNVCPVYERTGGHAYGSVYPGPIGAILTPLLTGLTGGEDPNDTLPYASTLCGACYDVCPVKINIPDILIQLRAEHTETHADTHHLPTPEAAAMKATAWAMTDPRRFAKAGRAATVARHGIRKGRPVVPLPPPLNGWTASRDAPTPPSETFRDWWLRTRGESS
jgi:L-lactate dehydrogenase complex protein LldF